MKVDTFAQLVCIIASWSCQTLDSYSSAVKMKCKCIISQVLQVADVIYLENERDNLSTAGGKSSVSSMLNLASCLKLHQTSVSLARQFYESFINSHVLVKGEQELHVSWQARVCMRVSSTLMSWSNENKSCTRVDKREFAWEFHQPSCPDQTRTRVACELTNESLHESFINSHDKLRPHKNKNCTSVRLILYREGTKLELNRKLAQSQCLNWDYVGVYPTIARIKISSNIIHVW